ncbi:MAG TPA: hypothetical protein VGH01_12305 [Jatrophihabitantaceae bacterium]|jgi:hypothetical protein
MRNVRDSLSALRRRTGVKRPRWQYLVGGSIVAAIAIASGVAVAATSLEVLSDGSSGGGYTFNCGGNYITGVHGAVLVRSGTVCIEYADITGGVAVLPGASVLVESSIINGGIGESSPNGTQICDSTVHGGVTVTGSTGFVLIGDPANGCGANDVVSINAVNNHDGLVIVDNTVHGALLAVGNSGAGPLAGQTGPIVAGNHH